MNLRGRTVGILVAPGFDDSQVVKLSQILRFRGAKVLTIGVGSSGSTVAGLHGTSLDTDTALSDTLAQDLDSAIIPGGNASMGLRADDRALTLLLELQAVQKPIGAIATGASVLAAAGLARGRRMTGDPKLKNKMEEAGSQYIDQGLVVDHNVVTSQSDDNLLHFIDAIAFLLEPAASLR